MAAPPQLSYIQKLCRCLTLGTFNRHTIYSLLQYRNAVQIPPQSERNKGKHTLVVDLDETLVHSSFKPMDKWDHQFNISMGGEEFTVSVNVRPGAREFLKVLAEYYEIVIFTASLSEYANPVIDLLDPDNVVSIRLFRENCTVVRQLFAKDLSQMNRPLDKIILIDNSVHSFMFQPMNAIHILNYIDDSNDTELPLLIPFLKLILEFQDVRPVYEYLYKYAYLDKFTYIKHNGEEAMFIHPQSQAPPPQSDTARDGISCIQTPKHEEPLLCKQRQSFGRKGVNEVEMEIKQQQIVNELETGIGNKSENHGEGGGLDGQGGQMIQQQNMISPQNEEQPLFN